MHLTVCCGFLTSSEVGEKLGGPSWRGRIRGWSRVIKVLDAPERPELGA